MLRSRIVEQDQLHTKLKTLKQENENLHLDLEHANKTIG